LLTARVNEDALNNPDLVLAYSDEQYDGSIQQEDNQPALIQKEEELVKRGIKQDGSMNRSRSINSFILEQHHTFAQLPVECSPAS